MYIPLLRSIAISGLSGLSHFQHRNVCRLVLLSMCITYVGSGTIRQIASITVI